MPRYEPQQVCVSIRGVKVAGLEDREARGKEPPESYIEIRVDGHRPSGWNLRDRVVYNSLNPEWSFVTPLTCNANPSSTITISVFRKRMSRDLVMIGDKALGEVEAKIFKLMETHTPHKACGSDACISVDLTISSINGHASLSHNTNAYLSEAMVGLEHVSLLLRGSEVQSLSQATKVLLQAVSLATDSRREGDTAISGLVRTVQDNLVYVKSHEVPRPVWRGIGAFRDLLLLVAEGASLIDEYLESTAHTFPRPSSTLRDRIARCEKQLKEMRASQAVLERSRTVPVVPGLPHPVDSRGRRNTAPNANVSHPWGASVSYDEPENDLDTTEVLGEGWRQSPSRLGKNVPLPNRH